MNNNGLIDFVTRWNQAGPALQAVQDEELRAADPCIDLIALVPLFDKAIAQAVIERRQSDVCGLKDWQLTMRKWHEKLALR